MNWIRVSLLLCAYGFLIEFGSMKEFLTLEISRFNLTIKIFNLVILALIMVVADKIRYLPMLDTMALMSIIAWGIYYWFPFNHGNLSALVLYQILNNFQIPYFAYIFAKVSRDHFSSVSSFTHAAVFAGNFIGVVLLQLLVNHTISGQAMFYIIFSAQIIAILIAVCLPKLDRMQTPINLRNHSIWICEQLKFAYTNYRMNIWSLWFIGATALLNQFNELLPKLETTLFDQTTQWSANTLNLTQNLGEFAGVTLTLLTCYTFLRTKRPALLILIMVSLFCGGLMFVAANALNPSMFYISVELLNILYKITITMSSAEIAKQIQDDSYALIFGTNTFIAMALQLILSAVGTSQEIDPITWTRIFGGFYVFICLIYSVLILILFKSHRNRTIDGSS